MKNAQDNIEKIQDFVDQKSNAKSPIQKCIKFLTKEANKNKLDYGQLRYIFRSVRENCNIQISNNKKSLYQLPTASELESFYSVIDNPTHKLIFQVLQFTGLRVSELCKLEVAQIDFDENTVFIKEGKGKKDRIVPFGNKLKEKLGLYLFLLAVLPKGLTGLKIGLGIFCGGIFGNILERTFLAKTIDFIPLHFAGVELVFNIADVFQWVGAIFITYKLIRREKVVWYPDNQRGKYLVLWRNQIYLASKITLSCLCCALLLGLFSYTFLRS